MAEYLVRARPRLDHTGELQTRLAGTEIDEMKPFGRAMAGSLRRARIEADGQAVWEETCYCTPPLKQERAAVLDQYFSDINTETVESGEGWKQVEHLPQLFPDGAWFK